jgi:hypothetical protein
MAVTLNASTSSGLVQSADTSGIIELQNNGTTKLTVNSSGATIPTAIVTTLSDGTNSTSSTNLVRAPCKAWIKYSGTAQTIYASYNVSSVTYLFTGRYQVNFTTAFSSANYAACVTASVDGEIGVSGAFKMGFTEQASTYLAGSCVIGVGLPDPAVTNTAIVSAIFIGT